MRSLMEKGRSVKTELLGEEIELFPQKGMKFREDLLIADLHLGKVNHFRKAGVPVPEKANRDNNERLIDLIQMARPARVILLGDLFHSHYNSEWEVFIQIIEHFTEMEFHLVEGNHDILSRYRYEKAPLILHEEMKLGPFQLTHIPLEEDEMDSKLYNLAGHIHPSVLLSGKGKQHMKIPCFYFGERQGFLPAFGNFTGTMRLRPKKSDKIFVVYNNQVIQKN